MISREPQFYRDFRCLGGSCRSQFFGDEGLEFHIIGLCLSRGIYQPSGYGDVAVVVYPDLCNNDGLHSDCVRWAGCPM